MIYHSAVVISLLGSTFGAAAAGAGVAAAAPAGALVGAGLHTIQEPQSERTGGERNMR